VSNINPNIVVTVTVAAAGTHAAAQLQGAILKDAIHSGSITEEEATLLALHARSDEYTAIQSQHMAEKKQPTNDAVKRVGTWVEEDVFSPPQEIPEDLIHGGQQRPPRNSHLPIPIRVILSQSLVVTGADLAAFKNLKDDQLGPDIIAAFQRPRGHSH
jgi:hypothetical protein